MENEKPEKIKEPQTSSEQITTTVKQTVPKNPGRIAAGKKLAEHYKKAREAKKKAKEVSTRSVVKTQIGEQKETPTQESSENKQSGSFSLTQVLSVASIVVSLAGLYYKREELKRLFKNESKVEKAQKELIDHMVEVERQNVSETKKASKLKQMD